LVTCRRSSPPSEEVGKHEPQELADGERGGREGHAFRHTGDAGAMLDGDLWLENARAANTAAQTLARAAPQRLVYPVEANEVFVRASADEADSLRAQGFDFYEWGPGEIRFVTSWDSAGEGLDRFATALAAL